MVLTRSVTAAANAIMFENDVNQYGSYTFLMCEIRKGAFENDVNQYGSYTFDMLQSFTTLLRMM